MNRSTRTGRRAAGAAGLVITIAVLAACSSADASTATGNIPEGATNGTLSDRIDQAGHQFRNVDEATAPKIDVDTFEDAKGGWNLRVNTDNFAWAPEHVSGEAIPGEGHAHVFVDGEKVARLYGPWYYVSPAGLSKGKHTITVTLNANDHTAYAIDDVQITESVTIDSSGEGDGHAGHSH
jgi:hypothetical protein